MFVAFKKNRAYICISPVNRQGTSIKTLLKNVSQCWRYFFRTGLKDIFGTLSGPLALCMLMLSRSFSTPSMLMVMFSILGYLGCDIVGR